VVLAARVLDLQRPVRDEGAQLALGAEELVDESVDNGLAVVGCEAQIVGQAQAEALCQREVVVLDSVVAGDELDMTCKPD
jgi:hypothetical protein